MKFLTILALLAMTGCAGYTGATGATGPQGPQGPQGPGASTPTVSTEQQTVNDLVASENSYREGLGQTALTNGLSCYLYTITGGQYISASSPGATSSNTLTGSVQVATFLLTQSFNQGNSSVSAGLNVLPAALQANPRYQNLIHLLCQGQLVITETGYYNYDLYSDDGSILYIDGATVANDDGNHGIQLVSGQKYLRSGVHTFRLDFAQTGAGSQALILNSNGSLLDPMYFFH